MAFTVSKFSSPLSLGLRGVQLLFALLVFILGCVSTAKVGWSKAYPAMSIVCGLFAMLYYIPLLLAPTLAFFTPAIALGAEIFIWIWWLIAMATAASLFGDLDCSYGYYYGFLYYGYSSVGCKAGKGALAFAVLGWVLSIISLVLLIVYSIVPAAKSNSWLVSNYFLLGGIFSKTTGLAPAAGAGVVDPEAGVGERSVESGDELKTTAETDLGTYNGAHEAELKSTEPALGGGYGGEPEVPHTADPGVSSTPYPTEPRV
ncbi:CIC11C00000000298 [Sungouiella intermedia]|uniref:CIC11C00000000298 n=1 Tax=Sungouiella intermedia TaxID=45354 RepID=A0A1L0DQD4_9ASCO|nr:CIC11C00000000298 [[Candida] intermedia]